MRHSMMLLGLLALATAAAAATTHDFGVDDLRLVACTVSDGHVALDRVFDQGTSPGLAMEAEAAVGIIADPPDGQADAACSGGRCLVRVDRAQFPLQISRAGRYTRWVRGFFPSGGGWLHAESLDHGKQEYYTDCDGLTAGRWVWVKGPTYELSAGPHLLWLHNWHGGALLDKVALLPEGSPEPVDQGPAATALTPARQGWASTGVLAVPGLAKLLKCEWPATANGGKVGLELSLDGGATYGPLAPEALAAAGQNPVARIVLRAQLTAAPDGASPSLGAARVAYERDERLFVTIANDRVRATFLRPTATLIGLTDLRGGVQCLSAAGTAPPFALRHRLADSGRVEAIAEEQIKLVDLQTAKDALTARYAIAGGLGVRLTARLQDAEITWSCAVDNQSQLDVVEVVCPNLPGVRLGDKSEDDLLMTPNWQAGVETSDPVKTGGGGLPYPTGGGMCWLDLYEPGPNAHGLYLSGHDQSLMGSSLQAGADRVTDSLTFALTKYAHVRPGQRWTTPPVVLGVHQGDWHVAADAYRAWARSWMRLPRPPEWVREADGWYGLVTSADGPCIPFRQMPDFLANAREMGTNYIQVWGQMTGGSNCDSLPYPNPVLGTLDEFKAAVKEVRRWGGHITFYVSSQFWKVDYGDEPMIGSTPRALLPRGVPTWPWEEWINYALRGYGGEFSGDTELTEAQRARYQTKWLRTIICPYTEAWAKRHLKYWCDEQYGRNYGASGIYLDETCAAGERICFAANHGHEHHGIWGASLTRDMQDMVESGRRFDPDWTFAMEGCGDAVGQFADMNLISPASAKKAGQWGANRRFAPECFHYTFPEYLLYDGVANGMYGRTQDDCFLDVHLQGNRFDSTSVSPAAPYLKLRQRVKQLLYRARFMDTVGIATSDPAVRAKVNVLQDAANDVRLVNVANPDHRTDVGITVKVAPRGRWTGYWFDLEGQEGPLVVQQTAGEVSFAAPPSRASSVVLATRCEVLVRVPTATVVAGDKGALDVTLTNVGRESVPVTLTADRALPGLPRTPARVTVAGQRSVTVRLPLAAPVSAERRCATAHLVAKAAGQTVRRPVEVLVRSPFAMTASLVGEGVRVSVRNLSASAQGGPISISGLLWDQPATQPLQIAPQAEAVLTLPLKTPLVEAATFQAQIVSSGQTDRQDLFVRPLVVNAGFEVPGGVTRPAGWNYQRGEFASTETAHPAVGKSCLQLAGAPGAFVEADQLLPTIVGQRYAARCQMRVSAGKADRVVPSIVLFMKDGPERYVYLTDRTNKPADQWNEYAGEFTMTDDVARVAMYLYNVNSNVTAWYDDVQVTPVAGP